jgi:hypothetical protein
MILDEVLRFMVFISHPFMSKGIKGDRLLAKGMFFHTDEA